MERQSGTLEVGVDSDLLVISIKGRGVFSDCSSLHKYVNLQLDKGCSRIIVDSKDCNYMDSTFLGTLTGIAIRLRKISQNKIDIVGVNDQVRETMQSIGLTYIFNVNKKSNAASISTKPLQLENADKKHFAQHMLNAHENLTAADKNNEKQFKQVKEALRKEIGM